MGLELKIAELKPDHYVAVQEMPETTFKFYCYLMNGSYLSFKAFAIRITPSNYFVSPYELLHAKDSLCKGGFMIN